MVKITQLILAGAIAFLVCVIGHPLWLATTSTETYLVWLYWGLGIAFLCIAAALYVIARYQFLQYVFGTMGFAWVILWFFECFPAFSISLV